jgi:hypothetical protein
MPFRIYKAELDDAVSYQVRYVDLDDEGNLGEPDDYPLIMAWAFDDLKEAVEELHECLKTGPIPLPVGEGLREHIAASGVFHGD